MTIDLLHLMTLDTPSTYDSMIDYLFHSIDDLLYAEEDCDPRWPTIVALLGDIPIDDTSIQLGVAVLSCTWPTKKSSDAYRKFAAAFRAKIEKTEPRDRVESLMRGFED
jgi:hypothetical protein